MAAISQREARRLRRRVRELERAESERRNAWVREWPAGVCIATLDVSASGDLFGAIRTARRLRHAVVVTVGDPHSLRFYALPLAEERS